MPRTWPAAPIGDTGLKLKAPSLREQRSFSEKGAPKKVASEVEIAHTMALAIEDEGLRVKQGQGFELWRYAQGLAVKCPSGFVLYVPLEGQKLQAESLGEARA